MRYGNYYSTVYYSYSGGKGYARYSRVYSYAKNHYPSLYNYMFSWLNTEDFKVYKNTPSGSISVCKNYEANENGTYLGIFTCPLPFVPKDHSYCCGLTNAQYCCKFWDIPLNLAAAILAILMGVVLSLTSIYVTIQLCINRRKINEEVRKRKAVRRIGLLRRRGRKASSRSLWASLLFDYVHTASNYSEPNCSEGSTVDDEDNDSRNKEIKNNVIETMKTFTSEKLNTDDVTTVTKFDADTAKDSLDPNKLAPIINNEREISIESGFIEETSACDVNIKNDATSNMMTSSCAEKRDAKVNSPKGYVLKPLRVTPRISFNSDYSERTFLASKNQ